MVIRQWLFDCCSWKHRQHKIPLIRLFLIQTINFMPTKRREKKSFDHKRDQRDVIENSCVYNLIIMRLKSINLFFPDILLTHSLSHSLIDLSCGKMISWFLYASLIAKNSHKKFYFESTKTETIFATFTKFR